MLRTGQLVALVRGALEDAGLKVHNVRCVVDFDGESARCCWLRVLLGEDLQPSAGSAQLASDAIPFLEDESDEIP